MLTERELKLLRECLEKKGYCTHQDFRNEYKLNDYDLSAKITALIKAGYLVEHVDYPFKFIINKHLIPKSI